MQHAGTTPKNPHQKWQFGVEIDGFDAAFFQKCSGIEVENQVSRFAPGGSQADQKTAGRSVYSPVTLELGKSQESVDNAVVQWQRAVVNAAQGTGGQPGSYMRTVDIVEYSRDGTEIRRFRLFNAFPARAKTGELEGGSSDPTIQELQIEYQYAEQVA